jgi:transposase
MAKVAFDDLMSVGIEISKDTFHLVGFDPTGKRVLRKIGFEPRTMPAIYVKPFNKGQSQ